MTEQENEFAKFSNSIKEKSANTQRSYVSQYKKLKELMWFKNGEGKKVEDVRFNGKDLGDILDTDIIKKIKMLPNVNTQQAQLNIAIAIHRSAGKTQDKDSPLIKARENNKTGIKEIIKDTNLKLQQKLPSYQQVVDYTDNLFEIGDWKGFIINWMILNYQVRNVDLNFDIVMKKKEATDKTKNYIWLGQNKVVYIRNVYKTAETYGQKIYTITDPRVVVALKRIKAHQKHGEAKGTFIPNENQVGYYVLNATMDKMGEGNMFKIVVNHFSHDLQKIHEISKHRGSSMDVISTNYDIANV
mgnify:CR=1 FL=1